MPGNPWYKVDDANTKKTLDFHRDTMVIIASSTTKVNWKGWYYLFLISALLSTAVSTKASINVVFTAKCVYVVSLHEIAVLTLPLLTQWKSDIQDWLFITFSTALTEAMAA